jgi:heat-inducible transcriptional repressor
MMLSARAETILKSIIGEYIVSGVPVSSQRVTDKCGLRVSPATIRNEMMNLEQEGYITRPHTSAGSIPSDKGYRYYVDSEVDFELPLTEQRMVSHLFHQVEEKLEDWIGLAATLIAQLSQNMALVTGPKPADSRFMYLELIELQGPMVLAVFVLHGAKIRQQLVNFNPPISQSILTAIANKLNQVYYGLTTTEISVKDIDLSFAERYLTDCLIKLMQSEDEQEYGEPHVEGLQFTLNQPEFADSHRIQGLVKLVEQRNLLRSIAPVESDKARIFIGRENKTEALQNCSIVTIGYGLPREARGTIGVIGSTRMHYTRTIATVNYLSSVLSELVARLYGKCS